MPSSLSFEKKERPYPFPGEEGSQPEGQNYPNVPHYSSLRIKNALLQTKCQILTPSSSSSSSSFSLSLSSYPTPAASLSLRSGYVFDYSSSPGTFPPLFFFFFFFWTGYKCTSTNVHGVTGRSSPRAGVLSLSRALAPNTKGGKVWKREHGSAECVRSFHARRRENLPRSG